jgi:hypothetical protein
MALLLQHGHGPDLDLDLYQPWKGPQLLRWWQLELGIEGLGFM